VRVVIFSGAGKSFCSGYDRANSPYMTPPEEGWTMDGVLQRLGDVEKRYMRIWNFPKPTIAQVHGHCIAAGCYFQLVCDIAVAADDARLGHPVSQGGATSMPLWQVIAGPRVARYLLMTARTISGAEAAQLGLVTMSVPEGQLEETVKGIASDVARGDTASLRIAKESMNVDLETMGVGAMFRYHGHLNGLQRMRRG
jgi:enoyl-CoA hydratase